MTQPIHVVHVGAFGSAVSQYLERLRRDVIVTTALKNIACSSFRPARMHLLASWRPVVTLCRAIEEFCFDREVPFLPAILENQHLIVGPLVLPGKGPCWSCSHARAQQHCSIVRQRAILQAYYEEHFSEGPQGYLKPHAVIAASLLSQAIRMVDSASIPGGEVWEIDLLSLKMSSSRVVGVDGCPRCGLGRSAKDKTVREMSNCLAHVWRSDGR